MVGNIIPPYSWQQCVYARVSLNQQKIRRRKKKRFVFFNKVEAPSASTLTLLSDPALVVLEGQGRKGIWGKAWGSSLGNYSVLSTAGKNKHTQNLMSRVTKEDGSRKVEASAS